MTARHQGLVGIFLFLFVLVVWSYLGFIAVLAGSQKFVLLQEGNPERDYDMASYIRGAVLHFIVPPAIEIAFMAVSFSGTGKAWTTARAWRLVLAGYGVVFFLFGIIGLLATRSSVTAAYSALTSYIRYLESQLTAIYAVSVLGFALWIGAGLLFMFLPTHLKLARAQQRRVETGEAATQLIAEYKKTG